MLKFALILELLDDLGELSSDPTAQDHLFQGGVGPSARERGQKKCRLAAPVNHNFLVRQKTRPVGHQRAPQHLSSGSVAFLLFVGSDVCGQSCCGRQVLASQCFEQLRKMIYGWHRQT